MSKLLIRSLTTAGAIAFIGLSVAFAQPGTQPAAQTYQPQVGQAGKDVVWVPTPQGLVDRMLDMAKVTRSDYLIDLGSGDGRTVITAAKRGVRSLGIEFNPDMVTLSRRNATEAGVTALATFKQGDIFQENFRDATVVTLFLLPSLNLRLRPILLEMKPGTRVVSNSFDMDDWKADQEASAIGPCESYCRAMLWIVPAKVAGTWNLANGQLVLEQKYQMLTGKLTTEGNSVNISDAKMDGDKITFSAGGKTYTGSVTGTRMQGTVSDNSSWRATKG